MITVWIVFATRLIELIIKIHDDQPEEMRRAWWVNAQPHLDALQTAITQLMSLLPLKKSAALRSPVRRQAVRTIRRVAKARTAR